MSGRVLPQTALPAAHRTARGAFWRTSWEFRESFWGHSGDHFWPEVMPVPFGRVFLDRKRCASRLKIDVELTGHAFCDTASASLRPMRNCQRTLLLKLVVSPGTHGFLALRHILVRPWIGSSSVLGKLYGGRGLGTKVDPRCQLWCAGSVVV